ncbi:MAG: NAD-dependent epimerase/dehydratase family protein, partial [Candidatus Rokuibacteriota bacterium]
MRLLVLGGTVFLSKAVAALGVERGHEVTVAARGKSGEPAPGVRFVPVDRDAIGGLTALRGEAFDAVVDVARLPLHVTRALDALGGRVRHWTFVSTCSVYADQSAPGQMAESAPLLEPTELNSADTRLERYGNSKVACEELVRRALGGKEFVVRPGLIVGPGDPNDRFGYWPGRIGEGGEVLAPGAPHDLVQFIDVRDLAAWILDAAERGVTGTYDAVCPPMSRQQLLDEVATAMGSRPTFTWVAQDFLLAHGVKPWAGEDSLGLWLPLPEFGGFLSRDPTASLAAGLRLRSVGDTARAWRSARHDSAPLL